MTHTTPNRDRDGLVYSGAKFSDNIKIEEGSPERE